MPYNYNPQLPPQAMPIQQQVQQSIMPQQQNIQPLFPQPQGNVYNINSTLEVANVPVGAGISVALCMPENLMYIKTMQNGNPLFYPYKIVPFDNQTQTQEEKEDDSLTNVYNQLQNYDNRIKGLEDKISKIVKSKGGDWEL